MLLYGLLAGACGFSVGMSELLNRYKTFSAVFSNVYSLLYMLINLLTSVVAYILFKTYNVSLGSIGVHEVGTSICAGFGAMAFLRSSFFTFKDAGNKVIEIGPAAVLAVFLKASEREFTQKLSQNNVKEVAAVMKGLPFLASSKELPLIIIKTHRMLSDEEQKALSEEVLNIVNTPGSNEEVKNIILGTIIEKYAGMEYLKTAVASVRSIYDEDFKKKAEIEDFQKLLFEKAMEPKS